MPCASHQCHPVEYPTIQLRLACQPLKGVAVTLEFEATQLAIDDGHVDANGASPDTHFLNDVGVLVASMLHTQMLVERGSNIVIAHFTTYEACH